jgi:TonB family protein
MKSLASLLLLLPALLAPAASRAESVAATGALVGALHAAVSPPVPPSPRLDPREAVEAERRRFEEAMEAVVAGVPGAVVTSKARTDADQERLRLAGYRPHPHSQHRHGLAWDVTGPAEALDAVEERARARGLVPLRMRSPVTGSPYLHVQRYPRTPASLRALAAAERPAVEPGPPRRSVLLASLAPDGHAAAPGVPDWDALVMRAPVEAPAPLFPPAPRALPRPLGTARLELPERLRRQKARGEIVLLVRLDPEGRVEDVAIDRSDLPAFEDVVLRQVRGWRFTPPERTGPVVARLPIPIHVN